MNIQIMYKPLTYFLLITFVVIGTSCDNFLDVNDDPNAATEAPGDFLFSEASAVLQSNRNIEIGPGVSFFTQTYASNNSAGGLFLDTERYIVGPSDFSVTNNFGGIYTNVQNNLSLYIRDLSSKTPVRNNAIAQARILRDYTYWYLTVLFGDVPFSEANDPDIDAPKFDKQQDILDSLVVRIDESISMIETGDQSDAIGTADLFYGGDMDKWLKFANSLKLRILMMQYNTDNSVASDIQALINNSNLVRDNADNFQFSYLSESGRENQQYQLHADFAGGEPAFFYSGEALVDEMNADSDPRRTVYFDTTDTGDYVGVPAGSSAPGDYSLIGPEMIDPTFPGRILSAAETLLLEAEFLAREGQFVDARSKLEAGVRASINDVYTSAGVDLQQSTVNTYVANILGDYDTASATGKVDEIQVQLYIDLFEKVPENWTNWRRTKVPNLQPAQNAVLGSIIRRLPISAEEISANPNSPEEQIPLDTPMSFEN